MVGGAVDAVGGVGDAGKTSRRAELVVVEEFWLWEEWVGGGDAEKRSIVVGKLRKCAGLLAVLSLGKKVARVRVGDEGESSSRKPEVAEMRVPSHAPSPACNLRHALVNLKRSAVSDVLEGAITRQNRQLRVVINRTNSPTYAQRCPSLYWRMVLRR